MPKNPRKMISPRRLLNRTQKRRSTKSKLGKISRQSSGSCRNVRGSPDPNLNTLKQRFMEKRPSLWNISSPSHGVCEGVSSPFSSRSSYPTMKNMDLQTLDTSSSFSSCSGYLPTKKSEIHSVLESKPLKESLVKRMRPFVESKHPESRMVCKIKLSEMSTINWDWMMKSHPHLNIERSDSQYAIISIVC